MKVVILAGGLGSRISEESHLRPKPMIEIGGMPILWHIMKIHSHYGLNDFVICCGYKGYVIKEYFANYFVHSSDVTFDLSNNSIKIHHAKSEPWKVTCVDTGEQTMTGGRLKRVQSYLGREDFCMTYGDGVADVDIKALLQFHKSSGKKATLTAVRPPGRFGALEIAKGVVTDFREKPLGDGGRINGGFFVLNPSVLDLIPNDACIWERQPLEQLTAQGQLAAYSHDGFWQAMDTLRDKQLLENLWQEGKAPWKVWE